MNNNINKTPLTGAEEVSKLITIATRPNVIKALQKVLVNFQKDTTSTTSNTSNTSNTSTTSTIQNQSESLQSMTNKKQKIELYISDMQRYKDYNLNSLTNDTPTFVYNTGRGQVSRYCLGLVNLTAKVTTLN